MKNMRISESRAIHPDQCFIHLQGTHNFRDMGGYAAHAGRSMKCGILYRSDELSRLTDKDLEKLRELNIKTIIDLRAPNESKSKPDRIPHSSGIRVIHIPIYPHRIDPNFLQRWLMLVTFKLRNFDTEKFMRDYYHQIAFNHEAEIGRVLTLFADKNNLPALVHCAGGKDRTGYVAALVQLLAGVPRKTIFEDYLLTNRFMKSYNEKTIRKLRRMSLFQVTEENLWPIMEARTQYLEMILDDTLKAYGTIENYLEKACGVSHDSIETFRQLLLE